MVCGGVSFPFNSSTIIGFKLQNDYIITMKVFDIAGREVAILADGFFEAGTHNLVFNGAELASGIYFINTKINNELYTEKLLLIK